jgi:hypothetical protein
MARVLKCLTEILDGAMSFGIHEDESEVISA